MSALTEDNPVLVEIRDPERIKANRESYFRRHGKSLPIPPSDVEFYKEHNIT